MENIENKEMTSAGQIIKELAQIQIEKKWDLCTAERNVRNYAFIPSHMKVCELSFLNAKPPTNFRDFIDAKSFEKYVNCYASSTESRLFANINDFCLKAIIDYQPVCKNPSTAIDGEKNHIVNFILEKTEDFKAW